MFFSVVDDHPGGLFSKTEMSEVLTEIVKADPSFDKDSFLKQCESDIIPNILEVSSRLPAASLSAAPISQRSEPVSLCSREPSDEGLSGYKPLFDSRSDSVNKN